MPTYIRYIYGDSARVVLRKGYSLVTRLFKESSKASVNGLDDLSL